MRTEPIKPEEVASRVEIPEFVIKAVNDLIVEEFKKHYKESYIEFGESQIVNKILAFSPTRLISRQQVYNENWLEFAYTYEQAGWIVNIRRDKKGDRYWKFFKEYPEC